MMKHICTSIAAAARAKQKKERAILTPSKNYFWVFKKTPTILITTQKKSDIVLAPHKHDPRDVPAMFWFCWPWRHGALHKNGSYLVFYTSNQSLHNFTR